jgi:hypothetical protein
MKLLTSKVADVTEHNRKQLVDEVLDKLKLYANVEIVKEMLM